MRPYVRIALALFAALAVAGCPSTPPTNNETCTGDDTCPEGQRCNAGHCQVVGGGDAQVDDAGTDAGADAGRPDATAVIYDLANPRKDADCDGLSNAEEFANVYPGDRHTDPNDPDSDDDGIPDGVEAGRTQSVDETCAGYFTPDSDPTTRTDPTAGDSDGDLIPDGLEDGDHDGKLDPGESDPSRKDTDGDGLSDGVEDANQNGAVDTGETDPSSSDSDGDGLSDKLEKDHGTQATDSDTDDDGFSDGVEDRNRNGTFEPGAGETNPRDATSRPNSGTVTPDGDRDADGITDILETTVTNTDPDKADTDGDGLLDGQEDVSQDGIVGAGESNANSKDSDCDALSDLEELAFGTKPLEADSDLDGLADGVEAGRAASPETTCSSVPVDAQPTSRTNPTRIDTDCDGIKDGDEDTSKNGKVDSGETDPNLADSDGDGVSDGVEKGVAQNLDPTRCTAFLGDADTSTTTQALVPDSDGDGLLDGAEDADHNGRVGATESNPNSKDSDCDGLTDAEEKSFYASQPYSADSDLDGLTDGQEVGRTALPVGVTCTGFKADEDPTTRTSPTVADSDGDGISDGLEDKSHNGKVDNGESNPFASDSDGDGLADGKEDANKNGTYEAPGETNAMVADTDGDKIPDGVEDVNRDGIRQATETDPRKLDTDGDTCADGNEDKNWNHTVEAGETNPLVSGDCPPPAEADTDCDGLADSLEPSVTGTTRAVADTDGDGLLDGLELGVTVNKNPSGCPGFVADEDPGRTTNPLWVDSDCDGLTDGEEDASYDGIKDGLETDPANPDSDGDGLSDGLELGRCTNLDPANCAGRFVADADCGVSKTNATDSDSDGDGILDGTEDANQNGKVDTGELSPNNPADATGPDTQACAESNLRQVQLLTAAGQKADLTVAAAPDYGTNFTTSVRYGGEERGLMVFDSGDQIAGFAVKLTPALAGADINARLAALEAKIETVGTLSNKIAQGFTSWDGFGGTQVQYTFADDTSDTVGKAANDIVAAILGGGSGLLGGTALGTERGPFRLRLELIRRSANGDVVVGALTWLSNMNTPTAADQARLFQVDDLTNGSALAQFGDTVGVQCDRMTVQNRQKVDFVWVVDNSGSMGGEQNAVKLAAQAMADQLAGSTVDWRLAVITSDVDTVTTNTQAAWDAVTFDYAGTATAAKYCPFTRNATDFRNCMGSLGTGGSGSERFFRPFACAMARGSGQTPPTPPSTNVTGTVNCGRDRGTNPVDYSYAYRVPVGCTATDCSAPRQDLPLLPRSATENAHKLRAGAKVVVIFLSDTNEQSDGAYTANASTPDPAGSLDTLDGWAAFFKNFDGQSTAESSAFVAGIVCPAGANCSDYDLPTLYMNQRWPTFFSKVNGVFADLPQDTDAEQQAKIQAAVALILDSAMGQASPYILSKPPISSTIKVATEATTEGACNTSDIPRSRVNGFDYDGSTRALKFYGNCRPKSDQVGKRIAVSYRYWTDRTSDPDGNSPPCGGNCPSPKVCNYITNQCECPADCGGLDAKHYCNTTACAPVCKPDCGGTCGANEQCDTSTCQCQCSQNVTCGVGFRFDTTACACVCDTAGVTCGAGMQVNAATCACECKPSCGGACAAPMTCVQSSCACACDPTKVSCPAGKVVNPQTCACVCPVDPGSCGSTRHLDTNTCQCVCNNTPPTPCPAGTSWDLASCSCKCDLAAACPAGFTRDPNSCACMCNEAALSCAAPFVADPKSCSCVCNADCSNPTTRPQGCGTGFTCNTTTCGCSCNLSSCPAGYKVDSASCACVCDTAALACTGRREADASSCACVCKPDCGGCPTGQVCNMSTCACVGGVN